MTVIDADQDHDHRHDHRGSGSTASCSVEGRTSRFGRFIASPWGLGVLAVAAVLVIDAGGTDDGPGLCVFRRCTGGYCPGCGLTRSARHLTRGELGAAWHDHPLLVLLAVQGAAIALLYATLRPLRSALRTPRALALLAAGNGVLLLAIWVVRLVDGSIPRFF